MDANIRLNNERAIQLLKKDGLTGLIHRAIEENEFIATVKDQDNNEYVIMDHNYNMERYDYQEFHVIAIGIFDDMCEQQAYNKYWH